MKAKDIQQFVIYSRKSKFTGKGESIENQIEMCRQYIATHYSQEEAEAALVYEDEGFSGGTLERPKFKKMMSDSQKIKFAAIVVYRLDRISRNIGDFAKLIEDLADREIGFISIREQFDTSSPMGRAMMYIAVGVFHIAHMTSTALFSGAEIGVNRLTRCGQTVRQFRTHIITTFSAIEDS